MAAGIMAIISGVVSLFGAIGMWQLVKTASDITGYCSSYTGDDCGQSSVNGWGYFVVILMVAIGGAFLASGIGAVRRVQWGRISIIVCGSIACVFYLIVLISYGEPVLLVSVVWFGVITGLAAAESPATMDRIRAMRQGAQY